MSGTSLPYYLLLNGSQRFFRARTTFIREIRRRKWRQRTVIYGCWENHTKHRGITFTSLQHLDLIGIILLQNQAK